MTRLRADLLLMAVSVIWGTAFIAQKQANDSMGPITFVGARFLLSWLTIAPLALYEYRKAPAALSRADLMLAGFISLCLFGGSVLQQIGLLTTTATNGGFLTALYVIFVPPMVWALTGARPRAIVFLAGAVSIIGAWFLTQQGPFKQLNVGDMLVLVSDLAWATLISLAPIFLSRTGRPFFLAIAQFGVAAALGLVFGLCLEPFSLQGLSAALPAILYAGILSGGLAFTIQIVAQQYTPAAEAALVMSLESIFAAWAGAILLGERLTPLALFGCALILLGVVMVEVGPAMRNVNWRGALRRALDPKDVR